ncbi:MAG: glycosyltransferase family A protein [Synechococcaceae cyanobacterium]|nr:glycosyltransferase family A protein [Synechococcaceae cyanobacterium]
MLTVVICTCNRPEYLRQALQSIRDQTALASIAKVIVSENGADERSRAICESGFPDLPIQYKYQDPVLPVDKHFASHRADVETAYVAILHDDDWWLPTHVENALAELGQNNGVATFANHFLAESERHFFVSSYRNPPIWLLSGRDFSKPAARVAPLNNFLICLINACYHFSTFIGRTEACWSSLASAVADGNIYDTDRTFPIFLGQQGPVSYLTKPSAVIRTHPGQDSLQEVYRNEGGALMAQTTLSIKKLFPTQTEAAAALFNQEIKPCLSTQELDLIQRYLPLEQLVALQEGCGFDLAEVITTRQQASAAAKARQSPSLLFRLKCKLKPMLVRSRG